MKFGKVGQVGLVSAIAVVVATLFTACGSLNIGYVFVATNKQTPGQIEVYKVNSESGVLKVIPTSPFPSGGRDPIAEVVSLDYKYLYVVNQDDNNIVQFKIGTDGKLYPLSTVNTPGSFPLTVALNPSAPYIYGLDTLQPVAGCSLTNPCPGDLYACPTNSDGSLGTDVNGTKQCQTFFPLQLSASDSKTVLTPTGLDVTANGKFVYVTAFDPNANLGYLFAFAAASDGSLSALNGGSPYQLASTPAGGSTPVPLRQPMAVTSDSTGGFLFVADKGTNKVAVYTPQSSGELSTVPGGSTATTSSTAQTGNQPTALLLFNDKFLYATNSIDSNVSAYSVSSGSLAQIGVYASDSDPIAMSLDPRHFGFLYTVNFLGNSLSGFQIEQNTGELINTKNTPYVSSIQPTAITGIPHNGPVQ